MSTCGLCDRTTSRHLCTLHTARLAAGLAALPDLYAEVDECLVPRRSTFGEIVATRGAAGPRSPINEDVLDTVNWGRAAEVLRSWREDVRRVRWPHRGTPPPGSLADDCRVLAQQLDWIATAYPAAADLAREVWELEQQARRVVGDQLPRVQRLGVCVAVTDDAGTVCGAGLTRLPGEPVRCRRCGTAYSAAADLLLLAYYQPRAAA
ncbi:hypothetical protein SUDANB145_07165 (plasmid) [Streptomyces sp. enrichment culture]|uniref:hypothetical protein n=1 Tax=Streptomyces sp. enrichment culture TaxID=1795815 RepID=UPI003F55B84B